MDDARNEWFPGATADTEGDARFLSRLRERAPAAFGAVLPAESSIGLSWASKPFVGVELRHLTAPLRWLWVIYLDTPDGGFINCIWGDDTRFEDWGPIDGNIISSAKKGAEGSTPKEAADEAARWIVRQAHRTVRREDWIGARRRSRWVFTDTGATLGDTRPSRWRRPGDPDTIRTEHV